MKSVVDGTPLSTPPPPPPPEKWWEELPNGQYVKYLKADTFDEVLKTKETALVMFYAPCKYLKCNSTLKYSFLLIVSKCNVILLF